MIQEQFESAGSQHACAKTMDQQCRLVQPLQLIIKINQI